MAKLAGEVEIVLGPDVGDDALFQLLGIVDTLLPLVFAGGHALYPLGGGLAGGGAIGMKGVEHGIRGEKRRRGGSVFVEHGFEQPLDGGQRCFLSGEKRVEEQREEKSLHHLVSVALKTLSSESIGGGNPAYRNRSAETGGDVVPGKLLASLVIAGIPIAVRFLAEIDRQRGRVHGAEDYVGFGRACFWMRQVHVPEFSGGQRMACNEVMQDAFGPVGGRLPIDFAGAGHIVANRDGRQPQQSGLTCGGDGSGIPEIDAEIAATVDAGDEPFGIRNQRTAGQAGAIGWASSYPIAGWVIFGDDDGGSRSYMVAHGRIAAVRCHDGHFTPCPARKLQCLNSWRIDTVVVCQNNPHVPSIATGFWALAT